MCGLIGCAINKNNDREIQKNIVKILSNQKSRGIDGAGISILRDNYLVRFRAESPIEVFRNSIFKSIKEKDLVLFHHRYPTSTKNKEIYNHPISNETFTIHLIHNGIVTNDKELYDELKKTHRFETKHDGVFNDSEILLHVFEEELIKSQYSVARALKNLHKRVEGSYAIAILIDGFNKIILYRNDSYTPICVYKSKGNFYFSSEFQENNGFELIKKLESNEIGYLDFNGYRKIARLKSKRPKYAYDWNTYSNSVFAGYESFTKALGKAKGNKSFPQENELDTCQRCGAILTSENKTSFSDICKTCYDEYYDNDLVVL